MRRTFRHLSSLLLLAACAAPTLAADVQTQAQRIINSAGLQGTHAGLYVLDLSTGETLLQVNPDERMMPASNMKLVTTSAALKLLGPDFVFHTTLSLAQPSPASAPAVAPGGAPVAAPALITALIVHGDGDPGFADPEMLAAKNTDVEQFLQTWVTAVRNAHVTHIDHLIIDDRVFDNEWVHPTWPEDQLGHEYCAQIAGLDFYDNCLDIYTEPTSAGQNPRVRVVPGVPFLSTTNRAVTGNRADTFGVSRVPESNQLIFHGEVHSRRTMPYSIPVHDAPMLFGQILAHRLIEAGVSVSAIHRAGLDERLPAGRLLASVDDPLPLVLQRCNKDSQNLFAESFFKRMGRSFTGMPGSWQNGAAAVRTFVQAELGNEAADLTITDGSGLSRENRVTARALVGILAAMARDPKLAAPFRQSLSVGGSDGTLRKRFRHDFNGQVFGKSGYIAGVSSLSGYLVIPDGTTGPGGEHVIAFSFLFNGFKPPVAPAQVKGVQDQLVKLLDQYGAANVEPVKQGG